MMYIPNPKALVYSELYFISTSVPQARITIDAIFDDVSNEIFALFVATPVVKERSLWDRAFDAFLMFEVLN
jgi:hypothetical protein